MAPEVKIRNLNEATIERLKARADAEGTSMESLLRSIVADAVGGDGVSPADWEQAGFDEVDEIVPGRLYEVVADMRRFRIAITRAVLQGAIKWNSSIDELDEIQDTNGTERRRVRVWTNPLGIADRHLGETAEQALGDAMHWLSDFAGVDAVSRARRAAQMGVERPPGLVQVVESVGKRFAPGASVSWNGPNVANIRLANFNFQFSCLHDTVVVNSYIDDAVAATERHFRMATDAWKHVADFIISVVRPQ